MRFVLFSILSLLAANACAFECKFMAERTLDIDPAGLHTLAFKLGSSDLQVRGVAGLAKIEVIGKACASEEARLAGLTVDQSRAGDRVTLTPNQASECTYLPRWRSKSRPIPATPTSPMSLHWISIRIRAI